MEGATGLCGRRDRQHHRGVAEPHTPGGPRAGHGGDQVLERHLARIRVGLPAAAQGRKLPLDSGPRRAPVRRSGAPTAGARLPHGFYGAQEDGGGTRRQPAPGSPHPQRHSGPALHLRPGGRPEYLRQPARHRVPGIQLRPRPGAGGRPDGRDPPPRGRARGGGHSRPCRAAADGETLEIEYRMRHADGHWCWVHCRDMVFSRTDGIPSKVLGVAQDVTERKHAVDALRKSEALLERAQRIAELGSWEASPESLAAGSSEPGRWSDELYRIWGLSGKSFPPTAQSIPATIHSEDRDAVRAAIDASLNSGKPFRLDHRITRPDGTQRWVRQHGELEVDDSGVRHMIGTAQDVTEYRRLQDQFLQAQRLESIGRLAGGVAHDFNNLLTVILCCGELVLEELPPDGFLATSVGEIRKAAQRAAALTEQLLAFARRQVVQPKVRDLNLVIQDVQTMIGRLIGEDIDLTVHLEASGKVLLIPNQINQVLMNLAVNAREAMPHGGKLIVETHDFAAGDSRPELAGGSYVELAVGDTGSGMDEYTRSHLFEPFFTTKDKAKGTGLGLSTVYGIVKQAGGNIWVHSEAGAGTTFHICLPRAAGQVVSAEIAKAPAADLSGDETLLVAEDQAEVRHLAMEVLESYGYKVLGAASGPDALQLCAIYTGPVQMMVTDVVMPGMTGPELAAKLTVLRPSIKVLFMSGYADKLIAGEGGLADEMAYLQKPFSPRSLAAKVRETLGPRSA